MGRMDRNGSCIYCKRKDEMAKEEARYMRVNLPGSRGVESSAQVDKLRILSGGVGTMSSLLGGA